MVEPSPVNSTSGLNSPTNSQRLSSNSPSFTAPQLNYVVEEITPMDKYIIYFPGKSRKKTDLEDKKLMLADKFLLKFGVTATGITDRKEVKNKIFNKIHNLQGAASRLRKKQNIGQMNSPCGMTISDYFESRASKRVHSDLKQLNKTNWENFALCLLTAEAKKLEKKTNNISTLLPITVPDSDAMNLKLSLSPEDFAQFDFGSRSSSSSDQPDIDPNMMETYLRNFC